jgi:prepilin-type processing-associated H-X9-DG protein
MSLPRVRFTVRRVIVALAAVTTISLTITLVRAVPERGKRRGCESHLNQLAMAVRAYLSVHEEFPPATIPGVALPPEKRLSWITSLCPYFDDIQGMTLLFDRSAPWDSPANRVPKIRVFDFDGPPSDHTPPSLYGHSVLLCPANPTGRDWGATHYVGISGIGPDSPNLPAGHPRAGIFGYDRRTVVADVRDGLAQTMMLAETAEGIGPWIAGGPMTVRALDPARKPYVGRGRPFGGNHRDGLNVALADGSVRFLREDLDPRVFEALSTIAGGEPLPAGWDR